MILSFIVRYVYMSNSVMNCVHVCTIGTPEMVLILTLSTVAHPNEVEFYSKLTAQSWFMNCIFYPSWHISYRLQCKGVYRCQLCRVVELHAGTYNIIQYTRFKPNI